MINFHGEIGIDDEGHILYVSNIVGEPYIRGTEDDFRKVFSDGKIYLETSGVVLSRSSS